MLFTIEIGHFFVFTGEGNLCFAVLEWDSKFKLSLDDYITH